MHKTNLVAILNRKDSDNFSKLAKGRGVTKRDLFLEALVQFQNQITKKKHYEFKHQEIDRLSDSGYSIVVFEYTFIEIEELREKFNIGRNRLLREIICEYLDKSQ
jgi:hypothetical protein